jgi:hypothetical protein
MIGFLESNYELFVLAFLLFYLLVGVVAVIYMFYANKKLKHALAELERARVDIRAHSPMHAAHKVPYEERLKAEYAKRGIPWETTTK